jgi:hypothetical protein
MARKQAQTGLNFTKTGTIGPNLLALTGGAVTNRLQSVFDITVSVWHTYSTTNIGPFKIGKRYVGISEICHQRVSY